jgi:hypothetical protein
MKIDNSVYIQTKTHIDGMGIEKYLNELLMCKNHPKWFEALLEFTDDPELIFKIEEGILKSV